MRSIRLAMLSALLVMSVRALPDTSDTRSVWERFTWVEPSVERITGVDRYKGPADQSGQAGDDTSRHLDISGRELRPPYQPARKSEQHAVGPSRRQPERGTTQHPALQREPVKRSSQQDKDRQPSGQYSPPLWDEPDKQSHSSKDKTPVVPAGSMHDTSGPTDKKPLGHMSIDDFVDADAKKEGAGTIDDTVRVDLDDVLSDDDAAIKLADLDRVEQAFEAAVTSDGAMKIFHALTDDFRALTDRAKKKIRKLLETSDQQLFRNAIEQLRNQYTDLIRKGERQYGSFLVGLLGLSPTQMSPSDQHFVTGLASRLTDNYEELSKDLRADLRGYYQRVMQRRTDTHVHTADRSIALEQEELKMYNYMANELEIRLNKFGPQLFDSLVAESMKKLGPRAEKTIARMTSATIAATQLVKGDSSKVIEALLEKDGVLSLGEQLIGESGLFGQMRAELSTIIGSAQVWAQQGIDSVPHISDAWTSVESAAQALVSAGANTVEPFFKEVKDKLESVASSESVGDAVQKWTAADSESVGDAVQKWTAAKGQVHVGGGLTVFDRMQRKLLGELPHYIGDLVHVETIKELSDQEQQFVTQREQKVRSALKKLGVHLPSNRTPRIAICFSGEGYRGMAMAAGALRGFESIGLLDAVTYLIAHSGSAWFIVPWIASGTTAHAFADSLSKKAASGALNPAAHENVSDMTKFSSQIALPKIAFKQPVGPLDLQGAALANTFMRGQVADPLAATLSDLQASIATAQYPMPLLGAVGAPPSKEKKAYQQPYGWYEFNPYYVSHIGNDLSVPTHAFGRSFDAGESVDSAPELPLSYYLGLWGSLVPYNRTAIHTKARDAMNKQQSGSLREQVAMKFLPAIMHNVIKAPDLHDEQLWPAYVKNFMKGMNEAGLHKKSDDLMLVDGAALMPLPMPLVLRDNRKVDVIIMCDSSDSAGAAGGLAGAYLYANPKKKGQKVTQQRYPFPKVDVLRAQRSHVSVFAERGKPVVVYCRFARNNEYSSSIDPTTCMKPGGYCISSNVEYTQDQFDGLSGLMTYIVTHADDAFKGAIECALNNRIAWPH